MNDTVKSFQMKLGHCNSMKFLNKFAEKNVIYEFSKYYHLVATRYDHHQDVNGTYFNDMILPLINTLSKNNICFSSAIFPFSGHDAFIYPPHIFNYTNNAYEDVKANKLKERLSAKDRYNNPPYWRPLLIV